MEPTLPRRERIALGVLLLVAPIAFNATFAALGAVFDYPGILRRPTGEILDLFAAGGTGLVLLWFGFALSALLLIPAAALAGRLSPRPGLGAMITAVGVAAGLVQAIGLLRWVFLVPYLTRVHAEGQIDPSVLDLVFQTQHRLLGVAIGEHLGYLLTGAFTILLAIGVGLPRVLAVPGVVVGAALAVGSLEFVGPFEEHGWELAGWIVPIAYVLWSVWLVVVGIATLRRRE